MNKTMTDEARFWKHVSPEPNSGCWLWSGASMRSGYGVFRAGSLKDGTRRMESAHRFSCEMAHGKIPEGMQALHKCDFKPCVNPDHLYIGTHADNMRDMAERIVRKSYDSRGESNANCKLNKNDIVAIRNSNESRRILAARYCVCEATITAARKPGPEGPPGPCRPQAASSASV